MKVIEYVLLGNQSLQRALNKKGYPWYARKEWFNKLQGEFTLSRRRSVKTVFWIHVLSYNFDALISFVINALRPGFGLFGSKTFSFRFGGQKVATCAFVATRQRALPPLPPNQSQRLTARKELIRLATTVAFKFRLA